MHILYVNAYLLRTDSEQGVWGRKLVDELRAAGIQVTTAPPYRLDEARLDSTGRSRRLRSVKRHMSARVILSLIEPFLVARGLWNTLKLWLQARRNRSGVPDIVYGRVMYYDWAPWLIGRSLKRPVILEIHAPHYMERTFRGRGRSRLLRAFERVQWYRASHVRVVSKRVLHLMQGEGISPDRISFIPYGVELLRRPEGHSPSRPKPLRIVFVGSFCEYHGVQVLLRAFALARKDLPDPRLELIGDGLTRGDDERLARKLGIDDAVVFPGWLPREVMLRRVGSSDIAVAPFLALEPFWYDPAKILDYMSTGVAIIASNLDRIAEILQDGRGGVLVPPGDVRALANEIVSLGRDAKRRAVLGDSAQAILVEEGYSSAAVLDKVLSLCTAVVGVENLGRPVRRDWTQ